MIQDVAIGLRTTFIFVLEAPRDQDPDPEDYITDRIVKCWGGQK